MKRIFKLDRLRLRGLSGAKDEVLLTAIAQNLRRLVKFLCRPPPSAASPVRPSWASAQVTPSDALSSERGHLTKTQKSGSAAKVTHVLQRNPPDSRHGRGYAARRLSAASGSDRTGAPTASVGRLGASS